MTDRIKKDCKHYEKTIRVLEKLELTLDELTGFVPNFTYEQGKYIIKELKRMICVVEYFTDGREK